MSQTHPTVLVVEDEPLVRMVAVGHLTDEGFNVVEACNAIEALVIVAARRHRIVAVFTDIDMPGGMNGLELAAQMHASWPPVRIAVASGHKLAKADDLPPGARFFAKPYDLSEVVAALRG